jgi:hypothetical protein
MASGIQVSCQHGPGMEPPPPVTSVSIKGYVEYRGGVNRDWDFDDESASPSVRLGNPAMPKGVYRIGVQGVSGNSLSTIVWSAEYDHTTGSDPIDPVFGAAPPAGDGSVATPEDLVVTEAP